MQPTLLIMAAGLGSRFGGTKQLAEVGPNGEAFLDFAIRESRAAGVGDICLIVRTDIVDDVKNHLRRFHDDADDFSYVMQDTFGPSRAKPWGTSHAILAANEAIAGPFIPVNADDYYGPASYQLVVDGLAANPEGGVLAGFELGNTLPAVGAVSRGICDVHDGNLAGIVETHGIARGDDGVIRDEDGNELADDTPCSMNIWGFPRRFMDDLAAEWPEWFAENGEAEKSEFLLPSSVANSMANGGLVVSAPTTPERWIGVTNPDDLKVAQDWLRDRG